MNQLDFKVRNSQSDSKLNSDRTRDPEQTPSVTKYSIQQWAK